MPNQNRTPVTCPSCGDTLIAGVILAPLAEAQASATRSADTRPAPRGRTRDDGDGITAVCPEHGGAEPSKWGGLYCPARSESGKFCRWTHGKQRRRSA